MVASDRIALQSMNLVRNAGLQPSLSYCNISSVVEYTVKYTVHHGQLHGNHRNVATPFWLQHDQDKTMCACVGALNTERCAIAATVCTRLCFAQLVAIKAFSHHQSLTSPLLLIVPQPFARLYTLRKKKDFKGKQANRDLPFTPTHTNQPIALHPKKRSSSQCETKGCHLTLATCP